MISQNFSARAAGKKRRGGERRAAGAHDSRITRRWRLLNEWFPLMDCAVICLSRLPWVPRELPRSPSARGLHSANQEELVATHTSTDVTENCARSRLVTVQSRKFDNTWCRCERCVYTPYRRGFILSLIKLPTSMCNGQVQRRSTTLSPVNLPNTARRQTKRNNKTR